jgi:hypothetical protein
MDYRWLSDDEVETLVNPALKAQGFAELNINPDQPTCKTLGAFWDDQLVEAFTVQLYPILGPMIKVDNTFRDNGETARTLAKKMEEFLEEKQARGYVCIADTPITQRLCERFGMTKIPSPVYQYVRQ